MSESSKSETGGHPGELFYTVVAIILFAVTVVEVAVLYPPLSHLPEAAKIAILIILSLGKFAAVVAFFMHLYYDAPLLTVLFSFGFVMAAGTMVALIHLFPEPLHPLQVDPEYKEKRAKEMQEKHAVAPPAVLARLAQREFVV